MDSDTPAFIDPMEDCPWRTPREILARHGYVPVAPADLSDQQLPGRLWEFLYAAAGRRFFFCNTDHLSSRELYSLFWDRWLDEPTADIPPEAETNTTVIVAEFDARGMTPEEIWLRYYADKGDQKLWQSTIPDFVFPSHENPPFDRDRFLPVPPNPLTGVADGSPDEEEMPEDSEPDPLGLGEVDSEIAAAKTPSPFEESDTLPIDPGLQAELESSEPENWTPPSQTFAEQNVPLLPPDEITDECLTPFLWELLHNLDLRGFYVLHTDHLSDRELYAELWQRGLREPAHLAGRNPYGGWFHDFLGSWGPDEIQLWLRYYATDKERADHAREQPDEVIPPKERPPFQRDWRLPKGPF